MPGDDTTRIPSDTARETRRVGAATDVTGLVGHRFAGGTITVARWENRLLTDCTGRAPMADGLVHPIALFHVPIQGAGTSIAELFRLCGVSGAGGSVKLLGYDWEYLRPLREDVEHRATGSIHDVRTGVDGGPDDTVSFRFELHRDDLLVARVTNHWRLHRATPAAGVAVTPSERSDRPAPTTGDDAGDRAAAIPPWEMPSVSPERMKTMAALLRDPYPIHWDREATHALGLGGRVVNQGPLNLGYVANMLMAWAGDGAVRRLTVSFGRRVLDGDRVVARGLVRSIDDGRATCDVWLDRDGEVVLWGTAEVDAPTG